MYSPMQPQVAIRRIERWEAQAVADSLALAFQADPVSGWIFPDPDERAARQPEFFRCFVDVALVEGCVYATTGYEAVALWIHVDPWQTPAALDVQTVLRQACGPNYQRFAILDQAMHDVHPMPQRHDYLAFIGVTPRHQGHGLGAALISQHLARLDQAGIPAYLEASTRRSTRLYQRLRFQPLPRHIDLPNGPNLWPMWRTPEEVPLSLPLASPIAERDQLPQRVPSGEVRLDSTD